MHAPITNGTVNPPAKLYKRFTPTEALETDTDTVRYENNYYRLCASFRYVDATDKQEGEYNPVDGLLAPNAYRTVKCNGKYRVQPNDPREPLGGDLVAIDGDLWMIEEPVQRVRNLSLRNIATVYLSPRRAL